MSIISQVPSFIWISQFYPHSSERYNYDFHFADKEHEDKKIKYLHRFRQEKIQD